MIVMTVLLAAMALGGYSIWDSQQVYREGDASVYTRYKPGKDELSFEELRKINRGFWMAYGVWHPYRLSHYPNGQQ